jgi:hypothetical protein
MVVVGASRRRFDIPRLMPFRTSIISAIAVISSTCSIVASYRSPHVGALRLRYGPEVSPNSVRVIPIRKVSQYHNTLQPAPHVCACSMFTECSGKGDRAHWQHPPGPQPDPTFDSASAARNAIPVTQLRSKGVLLSIRCSPYDRDCVNQHKLTCDGMLYLRCAPCRVQVSGSDVCRIRHSSCQRKCDRSLRLWPCDCCRDPWQNELKGGERPHSLQKHGKVARSGLIC